MLTTNDITFSYASKSVLKGVSLHVDQGETLSIQGMSGSGKTTLLKVIAGLESPEAGRVELDGQDITAQSPQEREVVYLYQEPLLFPHLSLYENIAFGLRLRDVEEGRLESRVKHLVERLGLDGLEERRPDQLSGGQQQRVAFGRALIVNPSVLLLDEPFVSLDRGTRQQMQELFKEVVHEREITSLFVTHDVKEAIVMGDRIALLEEGELHQYDSIQEFIEDPASGVKDEKAFWASLGE